MNINTIELFYIIIKYEYYWIIEYNNKILILLNYRIIKY